MADYSKIARIISGADAPKVAGYLPAPPEARFISSSEEAAKKLTHAVKAESLRNELVKRGAKPVELDYAGLDDFAAKNAGQRVSADAAHRHLAQEGPLGNIMRVDQQPEEDSFKAGLSVKDTVDLSAVGPLYADTRKPYDPQTAFPATRYHDYTEQGRQGDHSGYREVLFEDPLNNGLGTLPTGLQRPINAHDSSYWVRYHNNPDSIAVQNIQSDVGQKWTKAHAAAKKSGVKDGESLPTAEMIARHGPVPTPEEIEGARREMQEMRQTLGDDEVQWPFDALGHYEVLADILDHPALRKPRQLPRVSPIAKDDNWKNFLARQVILEAAKEGKPISLPTGANANAVEMMPVGAAKHFYEKDMPERIRKIINGFDPKDGARVEVVGPSPNLRDEASILWGNKLHGDDVAALRQAISEALKAGLETFESSHQNDTSVNAINALARLEVSLDDGWNYGTPQSISNPASRFTSWSSAPDLPPDIAAHMQKVMSHLHLAKERGQFYVPAGRFDFAAPRREGTWIHMSPVARRQILENGMPVMSIGAAAALSGLLDQSSDR
jgi:hypothetical protein